MSYGASLWICGLLRVMCATYNAWALHITHNLNMFRCCNAVIFTNEQPTKHELNACITLHVCIAACNCDWSLSLGASETDGWTAKRINEWQSERTSGRTNGWRRASLKPVALSQLFQCYNFWYYPFVAWLANGNVGNVLNYGLPYGVFIYVPPKLINRSMHSQTGTHTQQPAREQ